MNKSEAPLRLILISGPKHSGKCLTAGALAKLLGGEAMDLDEIVEIKTGKSPRALYKEGPEIFRKAEAQALASLINGPEKNRPSKPKTTEKQKLKFIAPGGGLIDNSEAMALLTCHREISIVYLEVSAETAWLRILDNAAGGELPPFLNTENPRETHLNLHKRRAESYKALAHLCISAENKSPEEIAGEIIQRLGL